MKRKFKRDDPQFNQMKKFLSIQIIEHKKKTMTYANRNPGLGFEQAQKCGGLSQEKEEIKTGSVNIICCCIKLCIILNFVLTQCLSPLTL
jgi:hypothetical protein